MISLIGPPGKHDQLALDHVKRPIATGPNPALVLTLDDSVNDEDRQGNRERVGTMFGVQSAVPGHNEQSPTIASPTEADAQASHRTVVL